MNNPNQQQKTPEQIQQALHAKLEQAIEDTNKKRPTIDLNKLDKKRYRKVRWFFFTILLHVIWWDIILNRPLLEWFRTPMERRWRKIARRYRVLAIEMGGVLIKLGQFLSIRVDILPPAVTGELAGLQDKVPPVALSDVIAQIEADFGRPIAEIFPWFDPKPLGSASLSQAHLARIKSGETIVVKVLRPNIEVLVETDLAAIRLALKWLKFYKRVSTRVNLDWLTDEFTTVTRQELDFINEGKNAERFADSLAHKPELYTPQIYWDYTATHTLSMENVAFIKISDLQGIDAAGISRLEVAKVFYTIYMTQTFQTNFVHSDPHPGNVFVRPLRHPDEPEGKIFAPGDIAPYMENRPFQIVFIDFGMMAVIPDRLRASLREYAIGLGTRDAHRIVQSYVMGNTLLPGADLKRLEEAHQAILDRFWGVQMGKLQDVALEEAQYFFNEYRDLINEAPFQFQADMLFVVRSIGILSGMCTNLDSEFDPWTETIPFAEELAQQEIQQNWQGYLQSGLGWGQTLFNLPTNIDRVLTQTQRGNLTVQSSLAPDSRKMFLRLEKAIFRLTWALVAVGLLLAGVQTQGQLWYADGFMVLALLAFLWGMLR
ncbi:AarF/UbiB family protein [Anaerolineales bacterium HSG25]|nr:AarF/UbiB family protein [Anaerolineales bacterium HSG25]